MHNENEKGRKNVISLQRKRQDPQSILSWSWNRRGGRDALKQGPSNACKTIRPDTQSENVKLTNFRIINDLLA